MISFHGRKTTANLISPQVRESKTEVMLGRQFSQTTQSADLILIRPTLPLYADFPRDRFERHDQWLGRQFRIARIGKKP
jgi:hypothetical protein